MHYNYRLLYGRLVQPEKTNSNWFPNCAIRTIMINCSWISFHELLIQIRNLLTPYLADSLNLLSRPSPALRTTQMNFYILGNIGLVVDFARGLVHKLSKLSLEINTHTKKMKKYLQGFSRVHEGLKRSRKQDCFFHRSEFTSQNPPDRILGPSQIRTKVCIRTLLITNAMYRHGNKLTWQFSPSAHLDSTVRAGSD